MMDSYEAFFAEYAELMAAMTKNPGDLSVMMKYMEFLDKYTEAVEALEAIDEGELSSAELAYYIDVMARIQKILLSVAG